MFDSNKFTIDKAVIAFNQAPFIRPPYPTSIQIDNEFMLFPFVHNVEISDTTNRIPHIKIRKIASVMTDDEIIPVALVRIDTYEIHDPYHMLDECSKSKIISMIIDHQTTFNDYYHGKISFADLTLVMNQQ